VRASSSARRKFMLQTHDKLPYTPFRRRYAEWDYLDNALIWEGKSYGVFLDFWEREWLEPEE